MICLNKTLNVKQKLEDIVFSEKIDLAKPYVRIGILNLMPVLEDTEKDLIKVLNNPLVQIKLDFIYLDSFKRSKNYQYLKENYLSFKEIKNTYYDGMIVTGAPLEHIKDEDIYFKEELEEFLDYTKSHVKSTIFLCWASFFALKYFYNVNREILDDKLSGIYEHYLINKTDLTRGFDDLFYIPQSRYCSLKEGDILKHKDLIYVSKSNVSGPFMIESKDKKQIFLTGHLEYNLYTLDKEYKRDLKKGILTNIPYNYYKNNNDKFKPIYKWQAHAYLMYHNWLYYYVYD